MLSPRSLWHELKRRKVWRTAAVYAAVGWGVLQLGDVVWQPLGLPPWTMTFLIVLVILGFPLVLTLEWVFEVTSEGVRRTPPAERAAPTREAAAGRRALLRPMTLGGAVLLLAVLGVWRAWSPGESDAAAGAPVREDAVALFPCEVRGTGEIAHMSEGMVHLLASRLQQGTELLRPIDPRSVLGFLDREAAESIDPEAAQRYARRLGAGHYVRCDVNELFEGDLQVKAALYRTGSADAPLVDAAVEGRTGDVPALADELAARLLTGSVGSASRLAREAGRTRDRVPLDAWKAYVEGERAFRLGRYEEAMARLGEAVEVDSTFALAYYRLAVASNWAEQRLMETAALRRALAHADHLSPLDRALVEAYAEYAGGAHVEAKRRYREITRAWPEEQEAWYVLGEVLFHYGYLSGEPISRADTVLSRAAELDPGNQYFEVLFHLLHIAMAEPATARLDSLIARIGPEREWSIAARLYTRGDAAAVDSLAGLIESDRMRSFFFAESAPNLEAGERVAEAFTAVGRSDADRALGHLELAGIRVAHGDWDGALAEIRPAAALRPGLALELKAYMALAAPAGLTGIDMGGIIQELEAWDPPADEALPGTRSHDAPHAGLRPWLRLYLLGLLEARSGNAQAAHRHAEMLAGSDAPEQLEEWLQDLESIVRAEAARSEGDPDRALELLTRAPLWTVYRVDPRFSPIVAHFYPVVLRAELLLETGRPLEALRWYAALDLPFWIPTDAIGTRALIGRAQAHEALGEEEAARPLREEVVRRWPGAHSAASPL